MMSWTGGRRVPRDQGAKTVSMCSLNQHGPPTHLPCQSILNTGIHTFCTLSIINASNANQSNLEYWAEFLAHSLWHRTMHFLKVEWHFLTVEIWNFLTVEIWNYLKLDIFLFFTVELLNFLTVDIYTKKFLVKSLPITQPLTNPKFRQSCQIRSKSYSVNGEGRQLESSLRQLCGTWPGCCLHTLGISTPWLLKDISHVGDTYCIFCTVYFF